MKVLMINGSANKQGCTFTALSEIAKVLEQEGIESEIDSNRFSPNKRLYRLRSLQG